MIDDVNDDRAHGTKMMKVEHVNANDGTPSPRSILIDVVLAEGSFVSNEGASRGTIAPTPKSLRIQPCKYNVEGMPSIVLCMYAGSMPAEYQPLYHTLYPSFTTKPVLHFWKKKYGHPSCTFMTYFVRDYCF